MPYKNREQRLTYAKKYNKENYPRYKVRILASNKRIRQELIIWFKAIKKTKKCLLCNESDWRCLDFHHRDPKQKKYELGHMIRIGSKRLILEEIAKCDVLCANCHRKTHIKEDHTGNQVGPSDF